MSLPISSVDSLGRAGARGGVQVTAIRHYGMALLFVAIAFGATFLLQPLFPYPFLFLFFAAVMASAWFGEAKAGVLSVVVSMLLVDYFFLPPLHKLAIAAGDIGYFGAFIVCAAVASWVSSSMRTTREALQQAHDQMELRVAERTAELQKTVSELEEKERQRLLLESEKSVLSDKLEARKVIDRAKGILQRDLNLTEDEAYRMLQRESQQRRKSMKEIAESIILNEELKRGAH